MNKINKEENSEFLPLLQDDRVLDHDIENVESRHKGGTYYCNLVATIDDDLVRDYPEYAPLKGCWMSEIIISDTDLGHDIYDAREWVRVEKTEREVTTTITEWVPVTGGVL